MQALEAVKPETIKTFRNYLIRESWSRDHYRIGSKGAVDGRLIIRTAHVDYGIDALEGTIAGRKVLPARFVIFREISSGNVMIEIEPEREWTDDETFDASYAQIVIALNEMIKRSRFEKYSGPIDTENWEGYYLRNTGPNRVGKKGKTTLQLAMKDGEITPCFHADCIEFGFTMLYY